jgi:DNA-directed RNA polymerase specialized sigma24 family protein
MKEHSRNDAAPVVGEALAAIWPALCRQARRLRPQAPEDLLQDACVRWLNAGGSYSTAIRLQGYLSITMRNLERDRWERRVHDVLDGPASEFDEAWLGSALVTVGDDSVTAAAFLYAPTR